MLLIILLRKKRTCPLSSQRRAGRGSLLLCPLSAEGCILIQSQNSPYQSKTALHHHKLCVWRRAVVMPWEMVMGAKEILGYS